MRFNRCHRKLRLVVMLMSGNGGVMRMIAKNTPVVTSMAIALVTMGANKGLHSFASSMIMRGNHHNVFAASSPG